MNQKFLIAFMVVFLLLSKNVYAEEVSNEYNSVLDDYAELYGDVFEKGLSSIEDENLFTSITDLPSMSEIIKGLNSGELSLTPKQIIDYILKLLLGEVYAGIKLMAIVLAMSVLSSYLTGLRSGFGETPVTIAAFYVCYIATAGMAAAAFYNSASCASNTIKNIAVFMQTIVPVVIAILYTSGAIISAAALEPTIIALVEITVPIVQMVFIPFVMIVAALNIVNGMSERFKTDRMVKLLSGAVRWGLSVMLTIFVSLTGLKSIVSGGADGLTLKLSKFATSNLVPMVGGILAESVETVMGCSIVIKNSVGVLGIICLILIALVPILKLGATLIVFRITAAVAEPVSEPKIIDCISRLADSIAVLFSIVVAITVMFIIIVTIMINAGNSAVMLGR